MENKLKLGEHPITLDIARVLLGTPNVDKIMVMPLDDSFQFIRYLVDSRKAENTRLKFTVTVDRAKRPKQIELRNGVVVISEVPKREAVHLEVTLKEWSEFVAGQRSFANQDEVLAKFESVLARVVEPPNTEELDDKLEEVAEDVEYLCDGGEDN